MDLLYYSSTLTGYQQEIRELIDIPELFRYSIEKRKLREKVFMALNSREFAGVRANIHL